MSIAPTRPMPREELMLTALLLRHVAKTMSKREPITTSLTEEQINPLASLHV